MEQQNKDIRFIDLFSGIGGIRKGLEQSCEEHGLNPICVFTSDIKPGAISVFHQNHPNEEIYGDITQIDPNSIPDFDILCGGFPCQPFSYGGLRKGFGDTRGTLFFNVEEILRVKRPKGFIPENVEGLVNHDRGRTLDVIITHLKDLGYKVSYEVLNSKYFGVPQERKRIYIVGTYKCEINLKDFPVVETTLETILEHNLLKSGHNLLLPSELLHYTGFLVFFNK